MQIDRSQDTSELLLKNDDKNNNKKNQRTHITHYLKTPETTSTNAKLYICSESKKTAKRDR